MMMTTCDNNSVGANSVIGGISASRHLSRTALFGTKRVGEEMGQKESRLKNLSKFFRSSRRRNSSTELSAAIAANPGGGSEKKEFVPRPIITFGSSGLKLNLFGTIYGSVAIFLGIFWYAGLWLCDLFDRVTFRKIDPFFRVPITLGHLWGRTLLFIMRCFPVITGKENLKELRELNKKKKRGERQPVMYVANHCSWMDIPFVAMAIGWQNYKIIAKQELLKVPILSKSMRQCDHIVLDRTNRRSQLVTYKKAVQYLKDGVDLVTFAEGTRSRNGRLGSFKGGAFKMAETAGARIVPLSISYAADIQPLDYVFPIRRSRAIPGSIHVGMPITTEGKTDDQVVEEVFNAIAEHLPDSQKPEPGTPFSAK